jgi:hypothetical protein
MARKKDPPPALLPLKHRFVHALDNFINESLLLHTAVVVALREGAIDKRAVPIIEERLAKWRAAWSEY